MNEIKYNAEQAARIWSGDRPACYEDYGCGEYNFLTDTFLGRYIVSPILLLVFVVPLIPFFLIFLGVAGINNWLTERFVKERCHE